jgi:UDP-N-acetylglucosamine--N-acetylmuramyl-(pentapeptide) pyrophosphoryl-undecaprenol N-acetylglucosamine transferase
LTVAERLRDAGHDIEFVGTPKGLEARIVPEADVEFHALPSRGFDRSRPWTLLTSSLIAIVSMFRAVRLVRRMSADVVMGFGGYVSIPVGLAAVLTGTPLALHEQNSVPGLANKLLSRWAKVVGVTYEDSAKYLAHPDRVRITGNPVREAVLGADSLRGRVTLGLPEDVLVMLVFGGSRGARHLNQVTVELVDAWNAIEDLHVVHVAGRGEAASVLAALDTAGGDRGRYHVVDYIDDMGSAIAAADLVVSRAGATSLAELTALGKPAVLVPYPYATDDHQTLNARTVVDAGGAVLVSDADLDSQRFVDECVRLLRDGEARATMSAASKALGRPDAASAVAELARFCMNDSSADGGSMEVTR